jgi:hypothetical protein
MIGLAFFLVGEKRDRISNEFSIGFSNVNGPAAVMVGRFADIPAGGPMICQVFRERRLGCRGEQGGCDYNRIGHLAGPPPIAVG